MNAPNQIVCLAWYLPEQWDRLRAISNDPHVLEDTYLEWFNGATEYAQKMSENGIQCMKVHVDVEELLEFCRKRRLPIDSSSRAQFATHKARCDR
jgi:hypothetical protein